MAGVYELVVEPRETLLEVLRERLGLIGTKEGCDNGNCGTCTHYSKPLSSMVLSSVVFAPLGC